MTVLLYSPNVSLQASDALKQIAPLLLGDGAHLHPVAPPGSIFFFFFFLPAQESHERSSD